MLRDHWLLSLDSLSEQWILKKPMTAYMLAFVCPKFSVGGTARLWYASCAYGSTSRLHLYALIHLWQYIIEF